MNQPPATMIQQLTSAAFATFCNDCNAAAFYDFVEAKAATVETVDAFAEVLKDYARAQIDATPYTMSFAFTMAVQALFIIDFAAMASTHYQDFKMLRLRSNYAPRHLLK